MNKATNTIFAVPNDKEGQEFIRLAKKYLNKEVYRLRLKGRGKNRRQAVESLGRRLNTCHDMPISLAERFAVYIDKKGEYKIPGLF